MNSTINGTVRRFHEYKPQQLAALATDLELTMPLPLLGVCANYYREREKKRDPSVDELRFLDTVATARKDCREIALSEVLTNDPFVAVTYADMMNKRRDLHPEAVSPVTLGEALGMATVYLKRSGKATELHGAEWRFSHPDDAPVYAVGVDGGPAFLSVREPLKARFAEGDVFLLFHRGAQPRRAYTRAVEGLCGIFKDRGKLKFYERVPRRGVLSLLLPVCQGICYDLSRLASDGVAPSASLLFGAYKDSAVIAVDKQTAEELMVAAREVGLTPCPFAVVMNGDRTHITCGERARYSFETALLRRLTVGSTVKAILPAEQDTSPDPILHTPVNPESCPYLAAYNAPQRLPLKRKYSLSGATCKTEKSFFRSAVQTAVASMLSLFAGGGDYTEGFLAVSILHPTLDNDPVRIGELLAVILGIYRVQCEFGIPTVALQMEEDPALSHPVLTVFALSDRPTAPSSFETANDRVYCLKIGTDDDGLPSFEDLRGLFKELALRQDSCSIRCARVLSDERIIDLLPQLSLGGMTCKLTDAATIVGESIPLGVLLETARDFSVPSIGTIIESATLSKTAEDVTLPPASAALNAGERPEITVIAREDDTGIRMLITLLEQKGAICTLCTERTPTTDLSRAILLSQLTVVGRGASLPRDNRVSFALRVQKASGGAVLSFEKRAALSPALKIFTLENGVEEDVLSQFFK